MIPWTDVTNHKVKLRYRLQGIGFSHFPILFVALTKPRALTHHIQLITVNTLLISEVRNQRDSRGKHEMSHGNK